VSVAAASVREADSPRRRHTVRTSLAPRGSWETKRTLSSSSRSTPPHYLEGMLEGVEVVVRALLDAPGERELGDGIHEPADVERRPERLQHVQEGYRFRRAFLRLVFGLGRPLSSPEDSVSLADGLAGLFWLISARRRLRLRSMYA
jgi:hypothetical protein